MPPPWPRSMMKEGFDAASPSPPCVCCRIVAGCAVRAALQKGESRLCEGQALRYVGMTGLDPDRRFDKHKAGIQANRFVQSYGLRLLPQLYEMYNPMPYDAARDMEVELAIGLREEGYGVWQA